MPPTTPPPTAPELHDHLELLYLERAAASTAGLITNAAYMDDLEDEIEATRSAYVGTAVTDIAVLRALLDGPNQG